MAFNRNFFNFFVKRFITFYDNYIEITVNHKETKTKDIIKLIAKPSNRLLIRY